MSLLKEIQHADEALPGHRGGRKLWLSALALTLVTIVGATWHLRGEPGDGWPQQAKILEKMILYQKVRLLRNVTEEELERHHVDVVSLPPLGPLFWQQRETRLMARNLGYKTSLSDGKLRISVESSKDKFVRVSQCISDAAMVSFKLMAALLSLEASIHVCNLPNPEAASSPSVKEFERVWLGNRRLSLANRENVTSPQSPLRRLAFNVPSANVAKKNVKEAQMSCASQINGIISSLLYVDQYVSDSIYTCPPPNEVASLYPAKCSMSIGVLVGGVAKAAAALSDIAVECKDPTGSTLVPYSKQPEAGREDVLLAACLNNVGQATTYVARVGYQLDAIATSPGVCPEYPTKNDRAVCTENIAGLLADISQVATYLSAAASGCGNTTLVPFSCSSRIAATVTGLFDVAQGVGGALAWCNHPGPLQRKIAKQWASIQEQLHDKRYTKSIPL